MKTGRRDGLKSRTDMLESYLPDHNESISVVLEKFKSIGIDTPGLVALLGTFIFLILDYLSLGSGKNVTLEIKNS